MNDIELACNEVAFTKCLTTLWANVTARLSFEMPVNIVSRVGECSFEGIQGVT
jgi:hypothetical protein